MFNISSTAAAASIACTTPYSTYQDVVWSLQYSLCGNTGDQGGFCAFLYDNTVASLTCGGIGKSLGYAPAKNYTGFASTSGISGALIGVGFDTLGVFAASGAEGLSTGIDISLIQPNSLTIRSGTSFAYLTSISLSSLDPTFALMQPVLSYEQLRFRLTDIGNTLEIARLVDDEYRILLTYPVNLGVALSAFCHAGISYSAPLSGIATAAKFGIRNFHIDGITDSPTVSILSSIPITSLIVTHELNVPAPSAVAAITPTIQSLLDPYDPINPPAPYTDPCAQYITPTVKCGDVINYSGPTGTNTYYIDVGTGTGLFQISYNANTIPNRFSLLWNGTQTSTCFVGDCGFSSPYDAQLAALGFGPVAGYGTGYLTIMKTAEYPTTVTLVVDSPLAGSTWNASIDCIIIPMPAIQVFRGLNTIPAFEISSSDLIDFGSRLIGSMSTQFLTIKSSGTAPLSTLQLSWSIPDSMFTIFQDLTGDLVAPGATTFFSIAFAPTGTDVSTAQLHIDSNDSGSPFIVDFSGFGYGV